jgi:DNA-binding CsgD family transcriptional regulator
MAGTGLSQRRLASVVDSAESLVEIGSLQTLRQRAVEVVSSLLPSHMVSWNEVDLRGRSIAAVLSASRALPSDPEKVREYDDLFMAYVGDHPVIAHYQRTRDGRPYAISDFLSAEAYHNTNLYRHFYRLLSTEDQISFVLPDPRLIIGLAISRDQRGFRPDERAICTLLRTYLVQAYRNIDALMRVQHLLTTVRDLTDEYGEAALVLDPNGAPQDMNRRTHELLQRYFGDFDPHVLPREIIAWSQEQPSTSAAPFVCRQGDRSLVLRHVLDGPRDILLLFERSIGETTADGRQLGLTPRETEIVALLCDGLTTKRIAETFTISPRTVDKHVAAILTKLGVRSRLEAISLLANPRTR